MRRHRAIALGAFWIGAALLVRDLCAQTDGFKIGLVKDEDIVTATVNGELFTRYHVGTGFRPCLWPIVGPTGKAMTRAFPLQENVPGESGDHIHHRSMWFAHGSVNKSDFWSEGRGTGLIVQKEFTKIQSGPTAMLQTKNEWLDSEGKHVCTDVRICEFGADADRRWIDFDITLIADGNEPVVFGDTKEGTFGVRVADSIKVESPGKGHIVNSLGARDDAAWGKTASWVDYHGPIDGEEVGIAILNHPNSFRFPPYWHVRGYGLLASNVFGAHNFENATDRDGSYTLPAGETLSFFYRVLLHKGDEQQGHVPEAFAEYVKMEKPSTVVGTALRSAESPSASPPDK